MENKQQMSKYLKLARTARQENNTEDAKKFYDMVRTDDPENGEAKFFYAFYSLYEGTNGEIARRFDNVVKALDSAISCIVKSKVSAKEQLETIKAIVEEFTPLTWSLNRYMNKLVAGDGSHILSGSDMKAVCTKGVMALLNLGDTIMKYYPINGEAKELALIPWKEGVSLQRKWYAYKYEGKTPEEYTAKIQKIDPTYVMPKRAGCINISSKK